MREKLVSIAKGAAIAGTGAALTYLTAAAGSLDLGAYGPIVAAVLAVVVNAVRKFSDTAV